MTKRPLSVGLLAHVDAGKTTLSEALLYCSGARRTFGRVDHGDAFLDTHAIERSQRKIHGHFLLNTSEYRKPALHECRAGE